MSDHPYRNLPGHQFWRRSVAAIEPHLLDPVVRTRFGITAADKVATAGSCFAQHISRRLSDIGFNYFVPESGAALDAGVRRERGYGVFSARFGNLYTVRQLWQLFQEAMGERLPQEPPWQRSNDGRFIDPLRPNIEPAGFADAQAVKAAREEHIGFVRTMFLECDIFVFTLGLTEGWVSREHGDVFPLAPGVAGGSFDPARHAAVNFGIDEVRAELLEFLTRLKQVNPKVRVLLTVSPVPLIATFEPRHVLVSTSYSKAVLRVAAEEALRAFDWVDYFPSYEIITGASNGGRYYEEDLREVNHAGVSHAMRTFLRHYAIGAAASSEVATPVALDERARDALASVVCDEETIAKVSSV